MVMFTINLVLKCLSHKQLVHVLTHGVVMMRGICWLAVQTELLLQQRGRQSTMTLDPVPIWDLRLLAEFILLSQQHQQMIQEQVLSQVAQSQLVADDIAFRQYASHVQLYLGLCLSGRLMILVDAMTRSYDQTFTMHSQFSQSGTCLDGVPIILFWLIIIWQVLCVPRELRLN